MKRILLLSMGGTIASAPTESGLSPAFTPDEMLKLIPELETICIIGTEEVASLDSTNIQPEEWKELAKRIYSHLDEYDGFVVSHGTDTMAYTAAALSYMLKGLKKPVILTGAQLPIDYPGSDGKDNLLNAFRAAIAGAAGVYLAFNGIIIRGTRASKLYTENFAAFQSINAPIAGLIQEGGVFQQGRAVYTNPIPLPEGETKLMAYADPRVFVYKLIPGADPAMVDMAVQLGYRGILIEAYGAGGVPNYRRNFLPSIKRAAEAGVVVLCATQCLYEGTNPDSYVVSSLPMEAGAISTGNRTIEASAVKLMWALEQSDDPKEVIRIWKED